VFPFVIGGRLVEPESPHDCGLVAIELFANLQETDEVGDGPFRFAGVSELFADRRNGDIHGLGELLVGQLARGDIEVVWVVEGIYVRVLHAPNLAAGEEGKRGQIL
jgi:hypothetical protein